MSIDVEEALDSRTRVETKQESEWHLSANESETQIAEWRRVEELKAARRLLPAPVSLTGFGNETQPRLWRHRLMKALLKVQNEEKETEFCEKITPALKFIFEKYPEKVKNTFRPLYNKYLLEKNFASNEPLVQKSKSDVLLPFNVVENVKQKRSIQKAPKFKSGLIDDEYDAYLKHHHFLQHLATGLTRVTSGEYDSEIEAWRYELWRRNYGSPNPEIAPSKIPCGGCGAHLHCVDRAIPGYMPSEKFTSLNEAQLRSELCQRCEFMQHFNVSLNVNVPAEEYPKIISEIKNRYALVILMVDLLDFPCSIWPKVIDLIGHQRKIYVVGNKVDLLPKDSPGYLERIEKSLWESLCFAGADKKVNIRHLCLISAKTGYGVEDLVTKLLLEWNGRGDIILIGCTNVGKSTLFNALLQSDLCRTRENDLIQRATTSVWPGTTLNLLKFPIQRMEGWQLKLRHERILKMQRVKANEHLLERTLPRQINNDGQTLLSDRLSMNFTDEIPLNVESGHPLAQSRPAPKPFNPNDKAFANCYFFHDTPGAVYKEQILTLLTTEELLKTIPREIITPRTFSLRPFQTLFVGGLGRLDVVHATSNVFFTVFASHYLPIHVIDTEEARKFYETYLGSEMLGVPLGDAERLKKWPPLFPIEVDLKGISQKESCADVVLSSAGWVSITLGRDLECVLKAYTPEGRGLYVRKPPLLPFAVNLRGKKIRGTPCFEAPKLNEELDDDTIL
ncbi:50S ribosome-binding GTPase-like protein 1, partial [Dinothrombium tinctorium]